jgi:hypothetical protein
LDQNTTGSVRLLKRITCGVSAARRAWRLQHVDARVVARPWRRERPHSDAPGFHSDAQERLFQGISARNKKPAAGAGGMKKIKVWSTEARTQGAGGADGYWIRAYLRPTTQLSSRSNAALASAKSGEIRTWVICNADNLGKPNDISG